MAVTWYTVEERPDLITPAVEEGRAESGEIIQPASPESVKQQDDLTHQIRHVSYHPTQLALLQADAAAMGTPLTAHQAMLADWVAAYVPEPAPAPVIPAKVTMRQARLALLAAGKLTAVGAAINALPSPQKEAAQIEWEYSQEVQRHNGFVSLLAPTLGMDDEALDQLFTTAAEL